MKTFRLSTKGFTDIINVTDQVAAIVTESQNTEGLATVFVSGSTAGVTTIEYESGVLDDLRGALERLAPQDIDYKHDLKWGDGNGFAHVRAALLGPGLSVPFTDQKLVLGSWQQIVVVDFDNRPRQRSVHVQLTEARPH